MIFRQKGEHQRYYRQCGAHRDGCTCWAGCGTEDALEGDRTGLLPRLCHMAKESVRIFEIEFEPMAEDEMPVR